MKAHNMVEYMGEIHYRLVKGVVEVGIPVV